MLCPKCGYQLNEGAVCSNCGFNVEEVENTIVVPKSEEHSKMLTQKIIYVIKIIVFSVLGVVVLFMFFSAASQIAERGEDIMNIQSVGGQTLDEAYYFELGRIYVGYAMIARALGIFFAATLVWLGFKK